MQSNHRSFFNWRERPCPKPPVLSPHVYVIVSILLSLSPLYRIGVLRYGRMNTNTYIFDTIPYPQLAMSRLAPSAKAEPYRIAYLGQCIAIIVDVINQINLGPGA